MDCCVLCSALLITSFSHLSEDSVLGQSTGIDFARHESRQSCRDRALGVSLSSQRMHLQVRRIHTQVHGMAVVRTDAVAQPAVMLLDCIVAWGRSNTICGSSGAGAGAGAGSWGEDCADSTAGAAGATSMAGGAVGSAAGPANAATAGATAAATVGPPWVFDQSGFGGSTVSMR